MQTPIEPYYESEGITIYNADCRDVLPHLGEFDLLLTDPPYGINLQSSSVTTKTWAPIANDDGLLDIRFLFDCQVKDRVIFGANNFPTQLPYGGRWLVWDKRVDPRCDSMIGSPVELAWTSRTSGFDWIARVQHGGAINADGVSERVHPTQKPISLMVFVLNKYPKAQLVLDPFMGSGTTLVAAKQLGRKAVGIEIEKHYCDKAVERLSQQVMRFA